MCLWPQSGCHLGAGAGLGEAALIGSTHIGIEAWLLGTPPAPGDSKGIKMVETHENK